MAKMLPKLEKARPGGHPMRPGLQLDSKTGVMQKGTSMVDALSPDLLLILVQTIADVPDLVEKMEILLSLGYTCKALHNLASIEIYRHVTVSAPRTFSRDDSSLEQFLRTIINNQALARMVETIYIDQEEFDVPFFADNRQHMNYAITKQGEFFNGKDTHNVIKYISSLTSAPIFNDFPAGFRTSSHKLSFDLDHECNLKASLETDKAETRQAWIRAFKEGDHTALLALVLARCQYLKSLRMNKWYIIQEKLKLGHVVARPKQEIDNDFIGFVTRGSINTQNLLERYTPEQRRSFEVRRHGLLYKLEHIDLVADNSMSTGYWSLSGAQVLPYLIAPSLKVARVSILETNEHEGLSELPLHFNLSRSLKHLVLDYSHATTATLVEIINHSTDLETFSYRHMFCAGNYHNAGYDHVAVVNALSRKHGETLKVLLLQCDFANGDWYEEALEPLAEVKISSWKDFKVLVRLQAPIEYYIDYRLDDVDFYDNYLGEDFDASQANSTPMELERPLYEQLPSSLKQIEALWIDTFHPRYIQFYAEVAKTLQLGGIEPGVPELEVIILSYDVDVIHSIKGDTWDSAELRLLMTEAAAHNCRLCCYKDERRAHEFQHEPNGPAESMIRGDLVLKIADNDNNAEETDDDEDSDFELTSNASSTSDSDSDADSEEESASGDEFDARGWIYAVP